MKRRGGNGEKEMKIIVIVIIIMIECISYCSTQTSQSQIDALTDLYNSTNGIHWTTNTNWLEGDPCSNQWYGVTCNSIPSVTKLFVIIFQFIFQTRLKLIFSKQVI